VSIEDTYGLGFMTMEFFFTVSTPEGKGKKATIINNRG
jgi:hypothetical protein